MDNFYGVNDFVGDPMFLDEINDLDGECYWDEDWWDEEEEYRGYLVEFDYADILGGE